MFLKEYTALQDRIMETVLEDAKCYIHRISGAEIKMEVQGESYFVGRFVLPNGESHAQIQIEKTFLDNGVLKVRMIIIGEKGIRNYKACALFHTFLIGVTPNPIFMPVESLFHSGSPKVHHRKDHYEVHLN